MQFDWSTEIGGQGLKAIRTFLRKSETFDHSAVAKAFDLPSEAAQSLVVGLQQAGFVERAEVSPRYPGRPLYKCTDRGGRLRSASPAKRLSRRAADNLVGRLLARAAELNDNEALIFYVRSLHVFGSYLDDTPDLGGVDVAFLLAPRAKHKKDPGSASIARAEALGRYESNFRKQLVYGQTEVRLGLERVSPRLSIIELGRLKALGAAHKVIFEEARPL